MPDATNASQSRTTPAGRRWERLWWVAAFALVLLAGAAPAGARLAAPLPLSPAGGATTDAVPAFAWKPVASADQYEFQISADSGFNSPVLGRGQDEFLTKNTRATLKKTMPNGTYWWRVRALTADGGASAWSQGRSIKKLWAATANLQTPANGGTVVYPTTPLKLSWTPVPGARKYLLSIAYDPSLGSLVPGTSSTSGPVETTATSFTRAAALAPGTYYWGITPVDAEGNRGVRSPVSSFTWVWPSGTTPHVVDLSTAPEVYDPQFSWDRVLGAARYEVDVNSSQDFAPGSKVCCTGTTIGTSLSPTNVLKDNTYYWRVRAVDVDGNAGVWNVGPSFAKTFDNVPPTPNPAIKNLHMRDNLADPGTDIALATGYQTNVPLITWDPVPGASSYEVDVTPYDDGLSRCNWSATSLLGHWRSTTAVTAWTPLGTNLTASKPYDSPHSVATDFAPLSPGAKYCVRIRARSDRAGNDDVFGDYTYLDPNGLGWAFQWTGYPAGGACSPTCEAGYLGADDYGLPTTGTTTGMTPYFTWKPVAGASSYFVLVAKDPAFTNVVDYAFTQVPAYAPRTSFAPTTYPDETTLYYWAVLPAAQFSGGNAVGDPLKAAPRNFQKQSTPPTLLEPANGTIFSGPPTFRWTPADGARRYRLQISQDPSFGTVLEDVTTDSTAYTSNTTYPADSVLYWRVRADDENLVGLTWRPAVGETPATFQQKLPTPQLSPDNPSGGDFIPSWSWAPVDGAVAYDVSADLPDGTHRELNGLRTPVLTPILMYGTGIFSWRVRAEFPKSPFGMAPGPYTATHTFVRTIGEPTGARADAAIDHILLSWNPKAGVKGYVVQLSARPSFIQPLENVTTDNANYAPPLKWFALGGLDTGRLYWRVAALDEGNNLGDFTPVQLISRTRRMQLIVTGSPLRARRATALSLTVRNFESKVGVTGARVRISGAGIRARRLRTTVGGMVRFSIRPRRKGLFLVRASAPGYRAAQIAVRVR